jgi:glutamyl-tRNA reductase
LPEIIKGIKTVFVATGAPHVVLGCRDFEGHGEKLVIDIAVPRNVDPRVATLPNVQLINTDDLGYQQGKTGLAGTFDETLQKRTTEILEEECIAFLQWQQALSTVPVLTLLREKIEKIRQNELNSRRDSTPSDLNLVDVISKNVIQKILHGPTVRLKNLQTSQEISQQTEMLSHLFNINTPPPCQTGKN